MSKDRVSLPDQTDDQDLERRLAISLVAKLGFEGAIDCCEANPWDGVLKWVIALKETDEDDTNGAWSPRATRGAVHWRAFPASPARTASRLHRTGSLTETFYCRNGN